MIVDITSQLSDLRQSLPQVRKKTDTSYKIGIICAESASIRRKNSYIPTEFL